MVWGSTKKDTSEEKKDTIMCAGWRCNFPPYIETPKDSGELRRYVGPLKWIKREQCSTTLYDDDVANTQVIVKERSQSMFRWSETGISHIYLQAAIPRISELSRVEILSSTSRSQRPGFLFQVSAWALMRPM